MNSERLIGLTAVIMSTCTLVVFIYQTNLIRKQQYASVYPHLQLYNSGGGTEEYRYVLKNMGIGPALVSAINISDDSQNTHQDVINYIEKRALNRDSLSFTYSNLNIGMLISAGDEIEVIKVKKGDSYSAKTLYDLLNNKSLSIEIEYESIYGERWKAMSSSAQPMKL